MAPKLTKRHIELPLFAKLRVKYATQVLSHSVSAGISFVASMKGDDNANATALFIEKFDMLFNCFNSRQLKSNKKMGNALNDYHVAFLNECLQWLQNIKCCSSKPLPCLVGWQISIKSLLLLWEDLKTNHDFKFLLTFRLNQDCVENLFSQIRCNTAYIDRPYPSQFRVYISRIMVNRIFSRPNNSNCEDDGSLFLLSLKDLLDIKKSDDTLVNKNSTNESLINSKTSVSSNIKTIWSSNIQNVLSGDAHSSSNNIPVTDDSLLDLMKSNVLEYVAGYISRKLISVLCSPCSCLLYNENSKSSDDPKHFFYHKSFHCKKGLIKPSDKIIQLVCELEELYNTYAPIFLSALKVKQNFLETFREKLSTSCKLLFLETCDKCDVFELVLNLFLKIRINFTLKQNNDNFRNVKKQKGKKTLHFSHN